MKKIEIFFLLIVIACLLAAAIYTIGGALQDVDYHDLADLPLLQQQEAYEKMQTRREAGEALQLISAILLFVCFTGIMLVTAIVSYKNYGKLVKKRAAESEE